jgi:hypothetical protein
VIPVIASQGWAAYPAIMAAYLFKLLALIAVLLMPAGMANAAASAQQAAAASQSSHCSGHEEPAKAPLDEMDAQCMACAGLPAGQLAEAAQRIVPSAPRLIALTNEISGIILEIATPPPKLA